MAAKRQTPSGEGSSIWNSSTNITQPKFFKIILSQHECRRLRIPEDFASRYCKNMLNPVYLEVPSGEVWEVEVVHSRGQIYLGIGWQDFNDFYSISCGHFLMFGYNARSHFNVTIFDLSASEVEYPTKEIESDDSIDISDVVEHSVENLSHGPLGQERKRKRQEGEAVDDIPVIVQTKVIEEEKSQGNVVSLERSEGCREQEQQSNIATSKSDAERDKERAENYQRAKAFKSKNPFIISFMHPSYVRRPHCLSIPLKFARKYFMQNRGKLVLRVPGSGFWTVKCTLRTKNARINCGWKAFVLDNKLKLGDVCVLEVIKDTKLLLIDVTIFPGVSDSTNESINPEPSVPCSPAYQRAKAFTSENPFFIYPMQPSYVSGPSLTISRVIASKFFPTRYSGVVLQVPNKRSWALNCTVGTKNGKLNSGWKKFVQDNNLKVGDVCVFEQVSRTRFLFNVYIFPAVEGV
ncbi:B3 domain-containing transcription factor VRN1-like [Nicotiana tabacum]|uniref:B3 domain-containing protein_Os12g40080-like n=1 Tax=Nicotiana tabacum TaxID=4097 RepID=A0A1S4B728_TOBAC|nr:PREDICTED: B3 domain-containing protein LOC_Os12g40080-like [Nicotiana tabacum]